MAGKKDKNLWKRLYNDHSQAYERMVQCEDYQGNLLNALNDIYPLQQAKVVELGAGTGRITSQLLPLVKNIRAFDLTPAMIQIALSKLIRSGRSNWLLGLGDSREVPVPTASADIVVEGWSFVQIMTWHQANWRREVGQAINEMIRIARPGGVVILVETLGTGATTPNPPENHTPIHDYFVQERNFSSTWIRTDFRFVSQSEADEKMASIFGPAILDKLIETGEGVILPECTGIWWGRV